MRLWRDKKERFLREGVDATGTRKEREKKSGRAESKKPMHAGQMIRTTTSSLA